MIFTTKMTREVNARFLDLTVPVRYGDEDMPFDAPLRNGDSWHAVIDIDKGRIEGWPQGQTLKFDMKVCDQGVYVLLDGERNEIARIDEDYVPSELLPGSYGDYLALAIGADGRITNWPKKPGLEDFQPKQD